MRDPGSSQKLGAPRRGGVIYWTKDREAFCVKMLQKTGEILDAPKAERVQSLDAPKAKWYKEPEALIYWKFLGSGGFPSPDAHKAKKYKTSEGFIY
ncbi:hypothetical protein J6590_055484 [Homalodisca vitripennis]|nr:hypothetical protein J6590_055484 [Homalodisca vitripennis]